MASTFKENGLDTVNKLFDLIKVSGKYEELDKELELYSNDLQNLIISFISNFLYLLSLI